MKRLTLHRFNFLVALNASSLDCFNFMPTRLKKHILEQGSYKAMIYVSDLNFKRYSYISDISVSMPKNVVVFALTYVRKALPCCIEISL
jgi:hypothetical protein